MSTIKFRLAAKTDVGLVRTNNEDNFQVAADLSSGTMRWINNEICSLGDKGALLVVADGMGGMNAGEVASALAIETIREYFSADKLTPEITKNRFSIEKYMNETIVAADALIKQEAKTNPETKGMGTTIVIAWLLDGKLYVSWCGDSRAYIYNPGSGLHQITKDHSYVQSLVDKGTISREEAFDYPDSNIITRSLSDGSGKAKPESLLRPYDLCDNDIILLCTDGLSGMIRDTEMESVIRQNEHDMDVLTSKLIQSACDAEGSDNITICLCQILQGGAISDPKVFDEVEAKLNGRKTSSTQTIIAGMEGNKAPTNRMLYIIIVCLLLVIAAGGGFWLYKVYHPAQPIDTPSTIQSGTVTNDQQSVQQSVREATTGSTTGSDRASETDSSGSRGASQIQGLGGIIQGTKMPVPSDGQTDDDTLTSTGENINDGTNNQEIQSLTDTIKIRKGDTLSKLAQIYETTVKVLCELNNGMAPTAILKAGDPLVVPKKIIKR